MAIEILLVDDHSIVREGIRAVLSQEPDMSIVAESADGLESVELAKKKLPDVVVMDVTLPSLNGLEASQRIIKADPKTKVLILSMHDNRAFIEKALSYGAKGYILKESAANEVVHAIREVDQGRFYLSSKISSFVIEDFISRNKKSKSLKSKSALTGREREVLQLIAEGLSNKEIAKKLDLALKTVLVHRNNVMRKTNVHNQAQLIRFALKEGVIGI